MDIHCISLRIMNWNFSMMIKIFSAISDYLCTKWNRKPWFSISVDLSEINNLDNRLPIVYKWNDHFINKLVGMGYVGKSEQEIVANFMESLISGKEEKQEE